MRKVIALMLVQAVAFAEAAPPPVVGTYGALHYVAEAGDVVGTVITIRQKGDGYEVAYQEAEGEPRQVQVVPAVVMGTTVSFQLPPIEVEEYNYGKAVGHSKIPRPLFLGTITSRGLIGGFVGDKAELLPRKRLGSKDGKSK